MPEMFGGVGSDHTMNTANLGRRIVLAIYVLGLCAIAGFATPWENGIATNTGRVIPQARTFGSLFSSPDYRGGRRSVSLDLEVLAAEVGLWTLVAGAGLLAFRPRKDGNL